MSEDKLKTRLFRGLCNPSLQFSVTFLLAPLFAIAGVSFGAHFNFAEHTGLFLTLLLISATGFRSFQHERARLPPKLLSQLSGKNSLMVRYLITVATISIISGIAVLAIIVAVVVRLFS